MTHFKFRHALVYVSTLLALALCARAKVLAQIQYPFELPAKITATLDVNTNQKTPLNNMLLGLNCNWPEGLYGKSGYNNPEAQKLIRAIKPPSLRFPHGVWANFYDWESDGRRMTDNYETPYDSAVKNHPDLKYGFAGLHTLHQELGFDTVLTFNVNYDSPEKAAARLVDRRKKGFEVKWIELGNEIFWKTQRSEAVIDVEKYTEVSKAHAAALREVDPDVKISVPVHWRDARNNPWNMALKKHRHYDAITVHKHMGNKESRDGAAKTLGAGVQMVDMAKEIRSVFPGKPFWITEWSVGCGENAISVLGMADVYLAFFEHPELFELADYFQINASHALIDYDKKTREHSYTSYGAAYKIVRDVFQNSELLNSRIESTKIGKGKEAVDAVSAKAVIKDGKVTVFAINKTTRSLPLELVLDGVTNSKVLTHQTLTFDDLNQLKTFEMDDKVLTTINSADSSPASAVLPPLSINVIAIN